MVKFLISFCFVVGLMIVLIGAVRAVGARRGRSREIASPFECGFDPNASARSPFSLRFFILAVIFLIFDVEIRVLLPFLFIFSKVGTVAFRATVLFFLGVLLVGLVHE